MRSLVIKLTIVAVIIGGVGFAFVEAKPSEDAKRIVRQDLADISLPAYERQKVVYQMNEGGGWFNHGFFRLIGSLENHVAAVGAGNIDIRVILQGNGLGLLHNPEAGLRARLDALRAKGVRFNVCRNSLIDSAIEPSELYGVQSQDIVRAGVAEIAMLEAKGFVYVHP